MDKRLSFGVVRSEQTRLRGFGGMAGAVCLIPFAGQTVSVLPAILNQGERAGDKTKLVLRNGQAAFASFHGGSPLRLIRRVKGGILVAGVNPSAAAKVPARMLPNLPPPVPMKAKLRQLRGHVAWLLLPKLNPNPLADNLTQFPKARSLIVEHVQNLRRGKSPVLKTESRINPLRLF